MNSPTAPAPPDDPAPRKVRRFGRRGRIVVAILLVLALVAWIGQVWLGNEIEKRITGNLAGRGWTLQHDSRGWSPWRGMRFTGVKVARTGQAPVLELDNLEFHFPASMWFGGSREGMRLVSRHSAIVLRDEKGEIHLDRVSFKLERRTGELIVRNIFALKDGLEVRADGKILLPDGPAASIWEPNFGAVRASLASLRVEPASDRFKVEGQFTVDSRTQPPTWTASFNGEGGTITWQKIPLKRVTAMATLTDQESTISANLILPRGKANFELNGQDWKASPFHFSGTIADETGRSDPFSGRYDRQRKAWILGHLEGPADLWSLAKDIPVVASELPEKIDFRAFPGILVEKLVIPRDGPWTLGKLELDGSGEADVMIGGHTVEASSLNGNASFNGKAWTIRGAKADTLGGELQASGSYRGNKLSKAKIVGIDLKLAEIKALTGRKSNSPGVLAFNFAGDIDLNESTATGSGTMRLDNAPVIDVPLLDPTYDLFTALIPGIERSKRGTFEADFTAEPDQIHVQKFTATGGSLTVSAKGRVDLRKKRVDGLARGKLVGLPGLVTKPLARLLEMEVSGPFDDIRVKPLGPAKLASNTASATVGVAVDTLEEAGKITGVVLAEGIKAPFRWLDRDKDKSEKE